MLFNKRLFLVWALLLLAALMFVYCGDSDDPTEPVDPLAGAALCLSDGTCGVCPEGDSATVIEVTNCGNSTVLNWSATESSDWFDLSLSSGITPGSFTVRADTNKTTEARTGEIIVAVAGLADAAETLSVTQPLFGSIIHVSVESWTAAGVCDTSDAIAVTNCGNAGVLSWSAESDSLWLTILPSSGDTPGEFEVIADSNRSGAERTAAITVAAAGLSDGPATISVTQLMLEPRLCVSLSEWEASSVGEESEAISVVNCGNVYSLEFEVTEDEDWLTVSSSNGSTPESFNITADANYTGEDRTATVTVTAEGVDGSPWEITVEQPCVVAPVGIYDTPGFARDVFVSGGYAYVADEGSGLHIVNVSDPANPALAGSYDTWGTANGVFVSGDYAYVADDIYSGLQIIDVSDPSNPGSVGSYDTWDFTQGVFVSGFYAYVADLTNGLHIIDVSDPANPALEGSYNTPGRAWGVFVSGDYAYVADDASGLQIIDVSVRTSPTLAGSHDTPVLARNVFVSGDYAYVADHTGGLYIINVSDPANPTLAASCATTDAAIDVFVSGDYAYVADGYSGLQIIDVSDPSSPSLTYSYDTDGWSDGVFVSGEYVYVADYGSGLLILKVGL